MPQHKRITKYAAQDMLDLFEHANWHSQRAALEKLILLLPEIDDFLVRHEEVATARRLRAAFDRLGDL
jgi:hypothetical protein